MEKDIKPKVIVRDILNLYCFPEDQVSISKLDGSSNLEYNGTVSELLDFKDAPFLNKEVIGLYRTSTNLTLLI